MALPTLEKTWVHSQNNRVTGLATADDYQIRMIFELKEAMKLIPGVTVVGSSDGTTAALDGTDRWTDVTKLVWGTGAHSWIAFQFANADNVQLCIDLRSSSHHIMEYSMTVAGFSGGTTSARPTAGDEAVETNRTWHNSSSLVDDHIFNYQYSSDGKGFRFWIFAQNASRSFFIFEVPSDPVPQWDEPAIFSCVNGATLSEFSNFSRGVGVVNTIGCSFAATTEASSAIANTFNDLTGEWPMFPFGISTAQSSRAGRHARLADIWAGPTATLAPGTTFPSAGTRDFIYIDEIILPWGAGPVPEIL